MVDINYNSAFSDEAIYIVLGKLGVFQWDWWSFNASNWLAGSKVGYPIVAALAYQIAGLTAVRILNVVVSILLIEMVYHLMKYLTPSKQQHLAGMTAVFLIGISALGYYVSRLATYDMLSIYGLFLSLYALLRANSETHLPAKWYLISAVSLLLALNMKVIVGLYVPLFICYGAWQVYRNRLRSFGIFVWYFLVPLCVGMLLTALLSGEGLVVYLTGQVSREYISTEFLLNFIYTEIKWMLWLAAGAMLIMMARGRSKAALALLGAASILPIAHLLTHREATFDKHLYISVLFLAVFIGLAMGELWAYASRRRFVSLVSAGILGVFLFIGLTEINHAVEFNHQWGDTRGVERFLKAQKIRTQGALLSQHGPAVMLALYDSVHPMQVTTFDWIEYQQLQGNEGYAMAVADGYFEWIEIGSSPPEALDLHAGVYRSVQDNLDQAYELAYQDTISRVYKRRY